MERTTSSSFTRAVMILLLSLLFNFTIFSQWTAQSSGSDYDLYSIYFINSATGFIGSNKPVIPPAPWGGEILRTTNGGENWQRVLFDTNFRPRGIHFIDDNNGFAVGGYYATQGKIFRTTNGGINWFNMNISNIPHLFNIVFLNSITGYAAATYKVIKSIDGGNNWIDLATFPASYPYWGKIFFRNADLGFFCAGEYVFYKTTNGGANWTYTQLPVSSFLRDIKFVDDYTGFIVGDSGVIYKTVNQGVNWTVLNSGITQNLFSVFFTDINTGYVTAEATVLKTTNSGVNWFSVFSFQADTIFSAYFLNSNTGYISCDEGRVYKTTTGGVIGINQISNKVPKEFLLFQNYPNPFNPNTNIRFAVAKAGNVKVIIFDLLGREIESIVNQSLTPGTYEVSWDASGYSSGIYFYRILAGDFVSVKKMSLTK